MFLQFFYLVFAVMLILTIYLRWYVWQSDSSEGSPEYFAFRKLYLAIYVAVVFADWLQGPYVYALYSAYEFSKKDIAILFVAGFGASAVFGTIVGSMADKYGRKKLALLFCVFYSLSCFTKLYNNFTILLFGRILAGIATSLLFSVFESWMIYEHNSRGFPSELLGNTFSLQIFLNGCAAIFAGILASVVTAKTSFVAPFMIAMVTLIACGFAINFLWSENYGDSNEDNVALLKMAWEAMKNDKKIAMIGIIQSCFEGSMYVFVFMWTPVLSVAVEEFSDPNFGLHGLVFSAFMMCIMIGSSIFGIVSKFKKLEEIVVYFLFASFLSFFLIGTFINNAQILLVCFLVFETCCGIYFATMGSLRGKYVPEECRSGVMNIFRIPLNVIVVGILLGIDQLSSTTVFYLCSALLAVATGLQYQLVRNTAIEEEEISGNDQP
eukprot:TRINITY_DN6294_c0_g1_i1.p1 TRINITY_DN6294_c0_g1~~TRINITY_DN6294_c0_g1_i1.p1  ORF type:complete len:437 (-),score=73.51 TRINITY_DN6294_c0_g1_i1:46-1356(-)